MTILVIFLLSCPAEAPKSTKRFVVVDKKTNRALNAYEYDAATEKLKKIDIYNPESLRVTRSIEYTIDDDGTVLKTVESRYNGATVVTNYTLSKEYDTKQRLVKTVQTADTGKRIETVYGYDETGTLRGAVQKNEDNSLLMKDYE